METENIESMEKLGICGYKTVWHIIGKFNKTGFAFYEQKWVYDLIELNAIKNFWKKEGALVIVQNEYQITTNKLCYTVDCEKES